MYRKCPPSWDRNPGSSLRGVFWQKGTLCGLFFGSARPILCGLSKHSSKKIPKSQKKVTFIVWAVPNCSKLFEKLKKLRYNPPPHYLILLPSFYRSAIFEPVRGSASFSATRSVRSKVSMGMSLLGKSFFIQEPESGISYNDSQYTIRFGGGFLPVA